MKKVYVVRKYIIASSIEEALDLEKRTPPEDVWVDDRSMYKLFEELEDSE